MQSYVASNNPSYAWWYQKGHTCLKYVTFLLASGIKGLIT